MNRYSLDNKKTNSNDLTFMENLKKAKLLETEERSLQDLPYFLRKKLALEVWNDVVWMKRYD